MPSDEITDTGSGALAQPIAAEWDAGFMGCGEVIILLRRKFQPLRPGEVFKLTSHDLGAHEDLPAWCRMTGRRLLHAEHPIYLIEQKGS